MPDTQEPYCAVADLYFGNIPVPADAATWCLRGAREIDEKIGHIYSTPIVLSDSATQRPGKLLLKRINAFLATGRAIMALGGGGSDDQVQQYGLYLIGEAEKVLLMLITGEIVIPGAEPTVPTSEGLQQQTGPMISNLDESSFVEDFSAVFGNPASNVLTGLRWPAGYPYLNR